jgi:hypothetical protein
MTWKMLLGWLTISIMLWLPGYFIHGRPEHEELHLPNFVKILYGKWNRPLYLRGALLQTLGIVFAFGHVIEFWAFKLERPVLFQAIPLFILCIVFLGMIGILKSAYDALRVQLSRQTHLPLSNEEIHELLLAPRIQLERSWWQISLVIALLFAVLILPLIWLITNQAVQAVRAGEPLPGNWTWTRVIFTDVLTMLIGIFLCWGMLRDLLTVFTEKGIRLTRWFGLRYTYIKWSDIKQVDLRRSPIKIITPFHTIQLNILFFKNPERVINEIKRRVPESVILA